MQWTQWDSETSVGLIRHARAVEAIVGVLYFIYVCVCSVFCFVVVVVAVVSV